MKICFVVGTLGRGGAEKQLVFMLRALRQAGASAEILCLTRGESYETEIRETGVKIRWVGASENRLARLGQICVALRDIRPDIIQSSHFYTNIYAGAAGRFLKIPAVGAVRSDLIYEIESHRYTGKWQIRLPRVLIANTSAACRRLVERGIEPEKIWFVRNIVEIEDAETSNCCAPRPLTILFAGRLDRNKRPERFVRLASILTDRFPDLHLRFQIAGDGELRGELENTARELGLTPEKLSFLGECRRMSDVYRRADVLISTSEREGTSNVILEAMAYGLPVVATEVGGTAEILDETRGFLIAPDDENALAAAAAELIRHKNLRERLGATARRYVRAHHSPEYLQKHLTEIYQKLVPQI